MFGIFKKKTINPKREEYLYSVGSYEIKARCSNCRTMNCGQKLEMESVCSDCGGAEFERVVARPKVRTLNTEGWIHPGAAGEICGWELKVGPPSPSIGR